MKKIALVILFSLIALGVFAQSQSLSKTLSVFAKHGGDYTFSVIGDNRSGDRVYKKILNIIIARQPLFVINTGDMIPNPGNREQWAHFHKMSKIIEFPYFLVPGNHDIDDKKSEAIWKDEVDLPGNELYYSFNVDGDLFVVLDSVEPNHEKKIEGQQLTWLKRVLNNGQHRNKYVFLHYPLYLPQGATHEGEGLDVDMQENDILHRIFVDTKVTAVFAGHEHTYWRYLKDGVNYIITGGAGAPLYGRESFDHAIFVKTENNRVSAKVIDRDGEMRREFVLKEY